MIKFIAHRENCLLKQFPDQDIKHLPRPNEAAEIDDEFFRVLAIVHRITHGIINVWCMPADAKE